MSLFVKVCRADDLPPGEMLAVAIDSLPPMALYNVDGEFFATSNICTHAVATLTDGYLEGDQIECPMHGGMFSVRTGEATHHPCFEPIATYAVKLRDGDIFVAAG